MLLVGEILANAAAVAPSGVAATLDDRSMAFGEIDAAANQVARSLAGLGVKRGDRVLWWGETDLDAVPVFGALARLGGVFAPLNARARNSMSGTIGDFARASHQTNHARTKMPASIGA